MSYKVITSLRAGKGLQSLKKSEPQVYRKAMSLIDELWEHPETGTGHPEPLGGNRAGQWSRRITQKHRLIYQINKEEIVVILLSAHGHYDDR
ncbi:MAG: Txe/YoeB family addiction module toxin [Prevotellaceae bacterium]|jgi:toxin YoeB|nr:Txe/YoeB family addiction module toxin [Prevotellaceae bacterium]